MQYFRQSGAETFITVKKYVKQALILSKKMRGLADFTLPIFCSKMRHRFTLKLDFSKTVERTAPKICPVNFHDQN